MVTLAVLKSGKGQRMEVFVGCFKLTSSDWVIISIAFEGISF
jgi:hypothetical protein